MKHEVHSTNARRLAAHKRRGGSIAEGTEPKTYVRSAHQPMQVTYSSAKPRSLDFTPKKFLKTYVLGKL